MKKIQNAESHLVVVYDNEQYPREEKTTEELLLDAGDIEQEYIHFETWIVEAGEDWKDHPSANAAEILNHSYENVEELKARGLNMLDFYLLVRPKPKNDEQSNDMFSRLGPFSIPKKNKHLVEDLREFVQEMAQFEARTEFIDPDYADYLAEQEREETEETLLIRCVDCGARIAKGEPCNCDEESERVASEAVSEIDEARANDPRKDDMPF